MGHREQNSSCPVTWDDEPRGFLNEWEATPLEPTEDAKMQNDGAEPPAWEPDMRAGWTVKIDTQAARIAELEGLVAADFDMLDSAWKARAEAAEKALAEAEARSAALVAGAYEAASSRIEANTTPCSPVYPASWTSEQKTHYDSGQADAASSFCYAIRALTPADATADLDRLIAEARAEGMREAAKIARYYFLDAGNCADRENRAARIIATAILDRVLAKKEAGE